MIGLNLQEYTLSSALPHSFDISQVQESVEILITLEGQDIYTTTLYESEGTATFYELRQIVEQNMMARGMALAELTIEADYGDGTEAIDHKYIIFSRYQNTNNNALNFLQSHFLVNRSFYTVPRNETPTIPFFATDQENFSPSYVCEFEKNGVINTYNCSHSISHSNRPQIYDLPIAPASIKNWVENWVGQDCGKLLAFTAHVGNRSMKVYVVDETPCASFNFRNAYNAWESIFIFGTTTFKTEINRKEATMQNVTSFYDKTVTRKWEVTTIPLSTEVATWYNEFLESEDVRANLSQVYNNLPILIADVTSEISDAANNLIHIKFSWRFNNNAFWIR